jgi:hypothetical protein
MRVYYDNQLKTAATLAASPLVSGYVAADLHHPFLARDVLFTSNTAIITATWGPDNYLDSLALCDCDFNQAQVTILDQGGETVFFGTINTAGRVTIFRLPRAIQASHLEVVIYSSVPVDIGLLYTGMRTEFPRFLVQPDAGFSVTGEAETTANGQVYGLKWPVLRTFSAAWENIDNDARRRMEEFITTVQYVESHIIEPYDTAEFPPLYAVLTDGGSFPKRDRAGFWFNTNMSWREAK